MNIEIHKEIKKNDLIKLLQVTKEYIINNLETILDLDKLKLLISHDIIDVNKKINISGVSVLIPSYILASVSRAKNHTWFTVNSDFGDNKSIIPEINDKSLDNDITIDNIIKLFINKNFKFNECDIGNIYNVVGDRKDITKELVLHGYNFKNYIGLPLYNLNKNINYEYFELLVKNGYAISTNDKNNLFCKIIDSNNLLLFSLIVYHLSDIMSIDNKIIRKLTEEKHINFLNILKDKLACDM